MKRTMLALTLGVAGLALVVWKADWITAVGVFLLIWGNNVERKST